MKNDNLHLADYIKCLIDGLDKERKKNKEKKIWAVLVDECNNQKTRIIKEKEGQMYR